MFIFLKLLGHLAILFDHKIKNALLFILCQYWPCEEYLSRMYPLLDLTAAPINSEWDHLLIISPE